MASRLPKEPPNVVHQNAILCETIEKERRHQKLFTNFFMNPYKHLHVITGKVNSPYDAEEGEEDSHFIQVIGRASQEPVKKYAFPQTEAQEVGWITKPLLESDPNDRRLNFRRKGTPITQYMEAAWRDKEQRENLN